ncbi:MAG: hypothetical protein WAU07_00240 [Microgenomates group bacterium]
MLPLKELHPSCKDFSSQLQSQIEAVRAVKPRVITHLLRAATAYLNYNEMELKREIEVITEVYPSLDSIWLFEAWQSIK